MRGGMCLSKAGNRSHLQHVQVGPGVGFGVLHEPHRVVQDADDLWPTLSDVAIGPPCVTILHQISVDYIYTGSHLAVLQSLNVAEGDQTID